MLFNFDDRWFEAQLNRIAMRRHQLAKRLGLTSEDMTSIWLGQRSFTEREIRDLAELFVVSEDEVRQRAGLPALGRRGGDRRDRDTRPATTQPALPQPQQPGYSAMYETLLNRRFELLERQLRLIETDVSAIRDDIERIFDRLGGYR